MATTSLEGFTVVSTSGSATGSWSNTSNLLDPTIGEASFASLSLLTEPTTNSDYIHLSVPASYATPDGGAILDNLYVTYNTDPDSPVRNLSNIQDEFKVTGGNTFGPNVLGTNVFSGDKDYWGWTSKSAREALQDILDGTVKFTFRVKTSTSSAPATLYLNAFKVQITYTPGSAIGAPLVAIP